MGRSLNTLKGSDVTVTPIKLKYANTIPSASLDSNGITLTLASNQSFDYNSPSYGDNFLLYRSVRELYYMNYISGSLIGSGSGYEWYPQSTAASGTFDNDYRYFPTASDAQIFVISIPRAKFGENVARSSFSISSDNFNIIDDGNGNLVDAAASNVHVGNLLYNQGVGIITNYDYLNVFSPAPVVPPAPPITDGLRLSLFSDYGVELYFDGSVKKWNDLSGYNNHLLSVISGSEYSSSLFGSKPGVVFPTQDADYYMETDSAFSGLVGESACTIFIVAKSPGYIGGEGNLVYYSGTDGVIVNEGSFAINVSGSIPNISLVPYMSGSAGVNTGVLSTDNANHVYMFDIDYSKNSITELIGYKDNSTVDWAFTLPGVENTNTFQNGVFGLGYKTDGAAFGGVLVYNRGLNNTERTQVYDYLSAYYSTP